MPPWSSRLLPGSSRNELGPNPVNSNATSPGRSRLTETEILDNAFGIPSLPPPPHASFGASNTSRPTRTPSHGRSMSHPFPSLFSGKKKRQGESAGAIEFESGDDDTVPPSTARDHVQSPMAKKVADKDLMTGKCMTCDSMVRWPKDLKVFRCTVCLTINDLVPVILEARRGDGHRAPIPLKSLVRPGPGVTHRVAPLSVERTRQIIDQCITTYLLEHLKHDDGSASSPPGSPTGVRSSSERWRKPSEDRLSEEVQTRGPSRTRAIHLSERASNDADDSEEPDNSLVHDMSRAHLTSYSKSSPGSFFAEHMEQRDRRQRSSPSIDATRETPNRREYVNGAEARHPRQARPPRNILKPLEDYIVACFGSFECINTSFSTVRPNMAPRAASEGNRRASPRAPIERQARKDVQMSEMDAKTLLLGDFAENGSWWTGERSNVRSPERSRTYRAFGNDNAELVTVKSPRIDWTEANDWYATVVNAGKAWRDILNGLLFSDTDNLQLRKPSGGDISEIEDQIMESQIHTQRVLLKVTESLLKRPGRPLTEPADIRFLLIILANPLLYPTQTPSIAKERSRSRSRSQDRRAPEMVDSLNGQKQKMQLQSPSTLNVSKGNAGQHSGIIKRILGLLSNVSNECHHHIVSWFARYSDTQFQKTTDLIGSFVTYRLTRQHGKRREVETDPTAGLVPSISGPGRTTSAALHAALGTSSQPAKKVDKKPKPVVYNDDWQIKAAARVMALLFSANNSGMSRRGDTRLRPTDFGHSAGLAARQRAHNHGQIIPTSDFYNTLLDYSDLIADFEAWESRRGKFAFCQYPFFLSIWAKIQIMEHDARRQMEVKAREAFFDSIMTRKSVNQYLVLKIRRECLVEDSLRSVSEVIGSGGEEIKKGLRIEFKGEEGIDAGGLRKEWFLLLVRDVFNPEHGMFTYDEDSGFCYFNPNSFETTDQYFLVGIVLGLAIYNSTILDVALPPFAFRKLLAAGPPAAPGATSHAKPSMTYSLDDLAEFRPALANGLRKLLEFDGDVENTFCRDFVADIERYGQTTQFPLCPDGEKRAVTNANRREFVDLYVRYLLDTAVTRQFEPFKRGFFTVCGGNALSLFRPEEIELLIRGSDEPLDIASLRAVSVCENWGVPNPAETEPVIRWFWQSFQAAKPGDQRKLLTFITGSDRIPAMGATNLVIKLSCLGDDGPRFPVARTCFNMLSLWRYGSKQKLESMLWRAVYESEGFGLK
ncbi:HECT-domain-containing protein [Mollisia scopiformis]|uniref:HECT-type E3 ubiquitin transferase n=1 Tax=Mollisia scopiformis TaxID=149040 RepID=A0A194XDL4_MOLSC|nr:HECT-domain-containing protein [Mollisia scopiformis]KUJ18244.1 HECT-domain-containing protein [Mollisia scopiformis]